MRYLLNSICILTLAISTVEASPIHFGGHTGFGGHRGHHRGLRYGSYDIDQTQSRFEEKFDDIMTEYDDGLETIEDYYSSEEYAEVVDDTEWLVDRYDFFLSGVERTIARIDDYLSIFTDDLNYYDDLLAEYQEDEDLSEERLERIEEWISWRTDLLTSKIDSLTEKQTTLTDNLTDYMSFSNDLAVYLEEIIDAGGGSITSDDEATDDVEVTAIAATASSAVLAISQANAIAETVVFAIPEPHALLLIGLGASIGLMSRHRRFPRIGY